MHGLPDDEMNSFDAALFLNLSRCYNELLY